MGGEALGELELLPAAPAGLTVVVGLLPSAMVPDTRLDFLRLLMSNLQARWPSLSQRKGLRMGAASEPGARIDEAI